MNYGIEYTYPEQYIIYLNDNDLAECLKEAISNDSACIICTAGENLDRISQLINKQFNISIPASQSYVRDTVYKEAAKRWLKLIIKNK